MTSQAQNKKTVRHFQCRDYLWEIFEQMSAELECSTDYLINEAMRQYARSRNYGTNRSDQAVPTNPPLNRPARRDPSSGSIPSLRAASRNQPGYPSSPSSPPYPSGPPRLDVPQRPSSQVMRGPSVPPPPPPSSRVPQAPGRMPHQMHSVPPPLPGNRIDSYPGAQTQRPHLSIIFNGQKIPINKEEFVIGRSAKAADLPIKDGNISRRHAAVVFQRGSYYLKDLGSTNGIEFQGRQFDTKRIDEGDIFRICDYELQFTYR